MPDPGRLSPGRPARLRAMLLGPQGLSILSGILLGGHWFGQEGLLLFAGLAIPGGLALASLTDRGAWGSPLDGLTDLPGRTAAVAALAGQLRSGRAGGPACFVVDVDDFAAFRQTHDRAVVDEVLLRVAERLRAVLRPGDGLARLDGAVFAVVPAALRQPELETCIQLAARLQAAVAEPVAVGRARYYVTAAVGFALPRPPHSTDAERMLQAAEGAAAAAQAQGAGSIRAAAAGERPPRVIPDRLAEDVAAALDKGQIGAWFQPQISTDTGAVTGFEALARWHHPLFGAIAPAEFLPAIAAAGCTDRLAEVILRQALQAQRDWDAAGLAVPAVAVNLGEEDLRDPRLPERVRRELDRFGLAPQRLRIEILESVLLPGDDPTVTRNVAALAGLGVGLDLDDFGTGTASIAAIRRFAVDRIKIDRSFVTRIDRDRGQQDMVAAILSMAERLGLATIAEGVETAAEHAMLAQLGCGAVQGFGIAAPMPGDETADWLRRHGENLAATLRLGPKVM